MSVSFRNVTSSKNFPSFKNFVRLLRTFYVLSWYWYLSGWGVALEERKLRLTSAKVAVEAELGNNCLKVSKYSQI